MRRFLFWPILTTVLLLGCKSTGTTAPPPPVNPADPRLAKVHAVFLGDFGGQEGSALVREKIRASLAQWGRFRPVESATAAEAVLTGVAGFEVNPIPVQGENGYVSGGGEDYRGLALLRIVESASGETLWRFEYRRHTGGDSSASSRVAIQFTEDLKRAVAAIDSTP